ncbi:TetR/AcrR family transcriptional regulator [Mycobacterium simiae]|uniref:TetR/AcrR family transcriptional regulator n=1 Tax=Mycobacterium simiae TaxID=1784 RepID=UPI0005CA4E1C|nr:TetR/AcrR family transcriptional regulator [Mycobacterium simiae]PLV53242.1 transcriptional regulator [Mycobacterium tuberculosis variant microti OV254]BBX42912.1 TetR family transcriptional regulator [Mycobacterium simiae]
MRKPPDTRERIVSAAARLFLQRSYQAVGVDEICEAADARKGSFYYYFSSKCELAKAVVDLHAVTYASRLADFADDDPVRRLRAIPDMIGAVQVDFESQFGRAVGCPFGNLAAELSTTDDALRAHIAGCFRLMEEGLAQLCRQASAQGALREGVDPDRLAHCLLAQYEGVTLLAKLNGAGVAGIAPALRDFLAAYLSDGGHAR